MFVLINVPCCVPPTSHWPRTVTLKETPLYQPWVGNRIFGVQHLGRTTTRGVGSGIYSSVSVCIDMASLIACVRGPRSLGTLRSSRDLYQHQLQRQTHNCSLQECCYQIIIIIHCMYEILCKLSQAEGQLSSYIHWLLQSKIENPGQDKQSQKIQWVKSF